MTQQQYPGQFSQSARSEGDAGSSFGRSGEFSRFRASLPGPMCLVYVAAWCLMLDEPAPAQY